ncbi:hypothetical protein BGX38DRAFT_611324 [Terfezia claveryi]|nr:hypothetical protein BGX38DRAFT_611324 [Terfezia claveryi]
MGEGTVLQITLGLGEAGITMTGARGEVSVDGQRNVRVGGEFSYVGPQDLCLLLLETVMTPLNAMLPTLTMTIRVEKALISEITNLATMTDGQGSLNMMTRGANGRTNCRYSMNWMELFYHRNRGDLPRRRGNLRDNRIGDNYGRKSYAPPPSPNRSHRRTRSRDSCIRRGESPRRYRRSSERTPARKNDHYGNGKSRRRYSDSHIESKALQLAPISNQLKAAVGIRTYPTRTFGMALHVKRWLSDRYTKQASFNFGELPRSEGVKKHYILDPNDPNRYMNVPRPSQSTPGARGDYYRGAAWDTYQQEKREWLATQGCNYPDAWVSADAVDGDKGSYKDGAKDTFMVGSESGETTSVDASMSDAESDTTIRGPHGPRRNSFNSRQATPGDEMDTASEVSEDLISLDADDDNGVLLPALLDQRVTDISSMIRQTTIIDNQASAIPAVATTSMSALSELMTLSEVIAPAVLSQAITTTHAIASTPAPVVGSVQASTTVPGHLSTSVIIPDEDWNKEWEEEWLYHF